MTKTRYYAKHRERPDADDGPDRVVLSIGIVVFALGMAAAALGIWSSVSDRAARDDLASDIARTREKAATNRDVHGDGQSALSTYADRARAYHAVAEEMRALLERRLTLDTDRATVLMDGSSSDYNDRVDEIDAIEADVAQRATTLQALKTQLDAAFAALTAVGEDEGGDADN